MVDNGSIEAIGDDARDRPRTGRWESPAVVLRMVGVWRQCAVLLSES